MELGIYLYRNKSKSDSTISEIPETEINENEGIDAKIELLFRIR
jgi:hypothetical protein